MCNLYNITSGPQAIIDLVGALRNMAGNMRGGDVFPDYPAPIVRTGLDGERELAVARWGMPTPPAFLKGQHDSGVTNIRNVGSPHWRPWLNIEHRCIVPATSFSEYGKVRGPDGKLPLHWFAINEELPLFFFAGLHTRWLGKRKAKEEPADHDIFAFLTTEPNAVVAPIHPKAMPVILTEREEIEVWMRAGWSEARKLQRPLPVNSLVRLPLPEKVHYEQQKSLF